MNNFSLSVGVIVINSLNEILLIKSPDRSWEFPGGIIEKHESIMDAAKREVFEETGINIEPIEICSIYQNLTRNIVSFIIKASVVDGILTSSKESLIVGFYEKELADTMIKYLNFNDRVKSCDQEATGIPLTKIISFHE